MKNARSGSSKFIFAACHRSSHSCLLISQNFHFCDSPVMIEVGARLAGGRKAIMAENTIVGWHPFDAMVDAHCGFPVRMPPSFSPHQKCVQAFIPSDKNGTLIGIKGGDFDRLPTYHDSVMLKKIGDKVVRARDIMSFAAYCWFIGDEDEVLRDAKLARDEFVVEVEASKYDDES